MEAEIWVMTSFDKEVLERCVRVQEGIARLREERDAAHALLCDAVGERLPLVSDLWPKPEWSDEARERLETFSRLWDAFEIETAEFSCAHISVEDRIYLIDPDIARLKARARALYRKLSAKLGEPYNVVSFSHRFGLVRSPQEDALFNDVKDMASEIGDVARELHRLNGVRTAKQLERFADAYHGRVPMTGIMYTWLSATGD